MIQLNHKRRFPSQFVKESVRREQVTVKFSLLTPQAHTGRLEMLMDSFLTSTVGVKYLEYLKQRAWRPSYEETILRKLTSHTVH